MRILGIHLGHHASICILKDGEIELFIEEERLSKNKYDSKLQKSLSLIGDIDYCVISSYLNKSQKDTSGFNSIIIDGHDSTLAKSSFSFLQDLLPKNCKKYSIYSHHLCHASHAFYNSGFKEALSVVVDGYGSAKDLDVDIRECESVYKLSYPVGVETLHKQYLSLSGRTKLGYKPYGLGMLYSAATARFGFKQFEEGKLMGICPYQSHQDKIPEELKTEEYLSKLLESYKTQNYTQRKLLHIIKTYIDQTGCKNVCLSGGYGLNVITNYFLRKNLPSEINLYCEPLANDSGQSVGAAKFLHHFLTGDETIRPQKSLYLGTKCIY